MCFCHQSKFNFKVKYHFFVVDEKTETQVQFSWNTDFVKKIGDNSNKKYITNGINVDDVTSCDVCSVESDLLI